jgi:hypothetical protein
MGFLGRGEERNLIVLYSLKVLGTFENETQLLLCSIYHSSFISMLIYIHLSAPFSYFNRPSTAFQLTTSQTAVKYSALRFWYCK